MRPPDSGWTWFEPPPVQGDGDGGLVLARQFARLFGGGDGEAVLDHLKALTLTRCLGPDAGDAALRHLEGQRHLVLHILAQVARGRDG
jgi:hypothetical protein